MPMEIQRNKKATSCGDLMAVRKRMMDSAPTRENALAMLLPMISIISAVIIERSTKV
tara:strand:- start:1078 stop:1248 length:171 start_codon:yes stop_codon:yes gene_type:complete